MLTLVFLVVTFTLVYLLIKGIGHSWSNNWPSRGVEFLIGESIITRILTGNFSFLKQDVEMYQHLKKKGLRYGGYMELWNPILYVTDLDLMRNIMIKDFDSFADHRGFATEADPHIYANLFNLRGAAWRDLRVKMTPAFTTGKMRRLFEIFDSSAGQLAVSLGTKITDPNGTTIEMRPHLQNIIMDLIARSAFGVETDIFENPTNSKFKVMGDRLLKTFNGFNIVKLAVITILPKISTFLKIRMLDPVTDHFFSQIIRQVIEERISGKSKGREDFIQIMLQAKETLDAGREADNSKINVDEDMLISNCIVFLLGGFDTVDALLSWAVYELAVNPEVQDRLYSDLKSAYDGNDERFSYDIVVNEMTLLDQIVQETLRKYPPAVRLDRVVTKPYKIPDSDLVLPKDAFVIIPTYALHHDPEIYPEPEKFIPERFNKENTAKRHPLAYQPFGDGPRSCIGNRFALAEAKFALAHLILNFKLEPSEKTNIPPIFRPGGPLKPIDLMALKVSKR